MNNFLGNKKKPSFKNTETDNNLPMPEEKKYKSVVKSANYSSI